jgi:hypothetical protein
MISHHDSGFLSKVSETLNIWPAFRERAMPLFNSQHQNDRGIRWRGIAATAMVELLVLSALAVAVVRYVEWSSAVNLAEFMSATEPSSAANHSGDSAAGSIPPEIIFGWRPRPALQT